MGNAEKKTGNVEECIRSIQLGGPMRFKLSLILVMTLLGCEEKYEKSTPFNAPEIVKKAADLSIDEPLVPTNPDAGEVIGKEAPIDPLESQRRQALNVLQPIVWGQSMGGIDMTTTRSQAKSILSNPVSSSKSGTLDLVIYGEYLAVFWDPNSGLPLALIALEGYGGKLELPAPYDSLTTKQNISSYIDSRANQDNFVRALGRQFQNKSATFDCLEQRTCRFLRFDDGTKSIQFSSGRIEVNLDNTVGNILTPFPGIFPPRFTGELNIENSTLGAFTFQSSRQGVENQLNPALDTVRSPLSLYRDPSLDNDIKAFTFYYDDLNLGIQWTEDSTPETILVRRDFQGEIILRNAPDTRTTLGASMLLFIDEAQRPDPETVDDDNLIGTHAPQLMKDLDTLLYNRAANYDCETANTCNMKIFPDRIEINLNTSTFVVERDKEMKLLIASINQARFE